MRSKTLKPFGRGVGYSLRISLSDRNPEVARTLAAGFEGVDGVEVLEGDLLDLDCDALVSPANSFGFMDGGIDQAIDRFYGGEAQRAVLDRIAERFYGELPVGSAALIAMASTRFPILVVAPTMRVPGDSRGTINAERLSRNGPDREGEPPGEPGRGRSLAAFRLGWSLAAFRLGWSLALPLPGQAGRCSGAQRELVPPNRQCGRAGPVHRGGMDAGRRVGFSDAGGLRHDYRRRVAVDRSPRSGALCPRPRISTQAHRVTHGNAAGAQRVRGHRVLTAAPLKTTWSGALSRVANRSPLSLVPPKATIIEFPAWPEWSSAGSNSQTGMPSSMSFTLTYDAIARRIDHSLLSPTFGGTVLEEGCRLAARYGVASVCIKPYAVGLAARILKGTDVAVGTTIGFPHGGHSTAVKVLESRQAIADGATELDMVINIGRAIAGEWDAVQADIDAVTRAAHDGGALVKVIFENCYLNDEQKIRLCHICGEVNADYVKTSTGYGTGGATLDDLRLMRRESPPHVKVKAAGGVRTLDQMIECAQIGCDRIGASRTDAILDELIARLGLPSRNAGAASGGVNQQGKNPDSGY